MVMGLIGRSGATASCCSAGSVGADRLGPRQRRDLAVRALAGAESVTGLAAGHNVSRQFVYRQAGKASEALDEAFADSAKEDSVLFELAVTKQWVRAFVVGLVLVCHSSFRGVAEILADLLGLPISVGTVHNIVQEAIEKARAVNEAEDLSGIRVGAHDEIYQGGRPVLVGVDLESTYCYLLAEVDHCDETSWGVHLLDLSDRGLALARTIADGGTALRAGQATAWQGVPCDADVFHAERDLGRLAYYLENRARGCITAREQLERKMERRKKKRQGRTLSAKLASARRAEARAIQLAEDIRLLTDWMTHDVLSLAGPDLATRRQLFDFVVEELRQREALCRHRIQPVRKMLANHRDDLLGFVRILGEHFAALARQFHVSVQAIHEVCELQGFSRAHAAYWRREAALRRKLRGSFHLVQAEVRRILSETPRASSLVENLNSRLRNYFFLRRTVGNGYLDLLRFFLNHHRFLRSDRPQRVGKSPAELLLGEPQPHWLELLGFQRFQRN